MLLPNLNKIELWEEKIGKNDKLEEVLSNKLEELKITVGQTFDFYDKIKEEDEKVILKYLPDDDLVEDEEEKIPVRIQVKRRI